MRNTNVQNYWKKSTPYIWVSPSVLSLFLLTVVPTLLLFNISLTSFEIGYPWEDREYIGLDNYVSLFTGKEVEFWPSINLSIFVTTISVVMTLCIGLGVAVLFNRKIKFKYLFTTILILPMAVNPAIAGLMWKLLFSFDFGIINVFVEKYWGYKIVWLGHKYALFSTLVVLIWMHIPISALLLLAGLENINQDTIMAAKLDGCSDTQAFRLIVLPQLKPVIISSSLFQAILALQTFGPIFTLTNGGPGSVTTILPMFVYKTGFGLGLMGTAAAGAVVLVAITAILSLMIMWTGRKKA